MQDQCPPVGVGVDAGDPPGAGEPERAVGAEDHDERFPRRQAGGVGDAAGDLTRRIREGRDRVGRARRLNGPSSRSRPLTTIDFSLRADRRRIPLQPGATGRSSARREVDHGKPAVAFEANLRLHRAGGGRGRQQWKGNPDGRVGIAAAPPDGTRPVALSNASRPAMVSAGAIDSVTLARSSPSTVTLPEIKNHPGVALAIANTV